MVTYFVGYKAVKGCLIRTQWATREASLSLGCAGLGYQLPCMQGFASVNAFQLSEVLLD